jgi:hypothetical protein
MPAPRELTDDYRLDKILASNRGGSILLAADLRTGAAVVIKLIHLPAAVDAAGAARLGASFAAYAEALAGIRHPNLPAVLDSGLTADGGAFLVMESLEGAALDAHPLGAEDAPERMLPLLGQALAGLEELARHGLAHLNVCPQNLFLAAAPAPETVVVKLLGLGTAQVHLGEPWGEPESARFRAPELAAPAAGSGAAPDWRADCYSLALTACNALGATTVAFDEASGAIVQMPLALRFELANDEALRRILEGCLRRAPEERPAHAEIRQAFDLALGREAAALGREVAAAAGGGVAAAAAIQAGSGGAGPGSVQAGSGSAGPGSVQAVAGGGEPGSALDAAGGAAESGSFGDHSGMKEFAHLGEVGDLGDHVDLGNLGDHIVVGNAGDHVELGNTGDRGDAGHPVGHPVGAELDSLLDFFDMPDALPEIESGAAEHGAAGGAAEPGAGGGAAGHGGGAGPFAALAAFPAAAPSPAASGPQEAAADGPPPGEMLSQVDELLSALPPPPPAPAVAPAAAAAAAPAGRAARTPRGSGPQATSSPAGRRGPAFPPARARRGGALAFVRDQPRPVLLGGAGALLLAVAVFAFVLLGRGARQAPAVAGTPSAGAAAAPPAAPARPGRPAEAKLFDAESYMASAGDADERVRQALRELTFADQGALGEAGCRRLAAIQQTLATTALPTVRQDLANGLRGGDLGTLETVVEVASDGDVPPSQRGDLARARGLVAHYRLARSAAARGDWAQVLERCAALEGLSRRLHDPLALREQAAQALENEAGAAARDGRYDEAGSRLEPILRTWPQRSGTKELAKSYRTAAAAEGEQQAILDSLPAVERRHRPSEGLDLLRPLTPTPHLEQRIAAARQRLEAQLALLDAQPPQVVLREGFLLDYSRGTVVTLSFHVTDDYEVKSVALYARPESGRMRELPLRKTGPVYTAELPPSFHENGTVDFYVVATDLSGHEGYLGSKEKPLQVKRRQGFQQLLH